MTRTDPRFVARFRTAVLLLVGTVLFVYGQLHPPADEVAFCVTAAQCEAGR